MTTGTIPNNDHNYQRAPGATSDLASLKSTIQSKINGYEFKLNQLLSLRQREDTQGVMEQRATAVQELALDIAGDLTVLTRFKMNNAGDYYTKQAEPFFYYLKELRQVLYLFVSAEKL